MTNHEICFESRVYTAKEISQIKRELVNGGIWFHDSFERYYEHPQRHCKILNKKGNEIGRIIYEDDLHSQSLEPDCVIYLYKEAMHLEPARILLEMLEEV